jgi:Flp pilus assembly protein protease CpaA
LHTDGEGMPYGIAIAAGALAIYPLTNWPALLIT